MPSPIETIGGAYGASFGTAPSFASVFEQSIGLLRLIESEDALYLWLGRGADEGPALGDREHEALIAEHLDGPTRGIAAYAMLLLDRLLARQEVELL